MLQTGEEGISCPGDNRWRLGRDRWKAGAAEGAEAKQKVPGISFIPEDDWGRNC